MILDCSKPEFVLSIPARQFGLLIGQLYHLRLSYAEKMGLGGLNMAELDELLAAADAEFTKHQPSPLPLVRTGPGGDYVDDWPPSARTSDAPSRPGEVRGAIVQEA